MIYFKKISKAKNYLHFKEIRKIQKMKNNRFRKRVNNLKINMNQKIQLFNQNQKHK